MGVIEKGWKRPVIAGSAMLLVAGALAFVFSDMAQASTFVTAVRNKKDVPVRRPVPDGMRLNLQYLKNELSVQADNTEFKPVRAREIINHMTDMAMAWIDLAPEVFDAIKPLYTDPRSEVRQDAAFAIGFLGLRIPDLAEPAMEVLMRMRWDNDVAVRRIVTVRIGAIGNDDPRLWVEAKIALESLRNDADEKVRLSADKDYKSIMRRHPAPRAPRISPPAVD